MTYQGNPDYRQLDLTGEAQAAAARMEARAREPASEAMFHHLVVPLLEPTPEFVLEVGCGTASLTRRIAHPSPTTTVHASDKSAGMLQAARSLLEAEGLHTVRLAPWDVVDEATFPFDGPGYDLIVSSVMAPYLSDEETGALVERLATRLRPGGVLAFVEQDLLTNSLNFPRFDLLRRVYPRDRLELKRTLALGLRPVLREAGLQLLPRSSFLWTDDSYGPYTRDVLGRFADAAVEHGHISAAEGEKWTTTLEGLEQAGDFYYGLVYHCIAGRRL